MSRRTTAIAAALSVLALGSPLITGCTNPLETQYLNQGVEKQKAGNYQGAIDDWSKVIEINPQNAIAYNNRGSAKDDLGDHQGAITDYTKAIGIDPQNANAYINRSKARLNLGDNKGASLRWLK